MATTSLQKFITSGELTTALSGYALTADVNTELSNYTKTTNLPSTVFPNSGSGYIKFSSGHMIAWKSVTASQTQTTAWGSMYYNSTAKSLGDWPASFNSAPVAVVCHLKGGTDGFLGTVSSVTKTSAGSVYIYRPVSSSSSNTYYISIIGFGTWK